MPHRPAPSGQSSLRARAEQPRRTSYPKASVRINSDVPPAASWPAWTDDVRAALVEDFPDFEAREQKGGAL